MPVVRCKGSPALTFFKRRNSRCTKKSVVSCSFVGNHIATTCNAHEKYVFAVVLLCTSMSKSFRIYVGPKDIPQSTSAMLPTPPGPSRARHRWLQQARNHSNAEPRDPPNATPGTSWEIPVGFHVIMNTMVFEFIRQHMHVFTIVNICSCTTAHDCVRGHNHTMIPCLIFRCFTFHPHSSPIAIA